MKAVAPLYFPGKAAAPSVVTTIHFDRGKFAFFNNSLRFEKAYYPVVSFSSGKQKR